MRSVYSSPSSSDREIWRLCVLLKHLSILQESNAAVLIDILKAFLLSIIYYIFVIVICIIMSIPETGFQAQVHAL